MRFSRLAVALGSIVVLCAAPTAAFAAHAAVSTFCMNRARKDRKRSRQNDPTGHNGLDISPCDALVEAGEGTQIGKQALRSRNQSGEVTVTENEEGGVELHWTWGGPGNDTEATIASTNSKGRMQWLHGSFWRQRGITVHAPYEGSGHVLVDIPLIAQALRGWFWDDVVRSKRSLAGKVADERKITNENGIVHDDGFGGVVAVLGMHLVLRTLWNVVRKQ